MAIGTPTLILNDITVRATNVSTAGTTSTATTGSLIFCSIAGQTQGTVTTLIDSGGNTYTFAARSNAFHDIEHWYCLNAKQLPSGGTFKATTSAGGGYFLRGVAFVSGATGGYNTSASASTSGATTLTMTTSALAVAEEVAFASVNWNSFTTFVVDTTDGWTNMITTAQNGPFAYNVRSTTAAVVWKPSWTPSQSLDCLVTTFKTSNLTTTVTSASSAAGSATFGPSIGIGLIGAGT